MKDMYPQFVGITAINQFYPNVSSPRGVMFFSHFSSHVPIKEPESRLIKSGLEYELGKYINETIVEDDCVVRAVVPRYKYTYQLAITPEISVIVETERNGRIYIDIINVPNFKSSHVFFGYPLEHTERLKNIRLEEVLNKGEVLGKAKSHLPNGDYGFGVNANAVFMSHPAVSEDGYVISESFAKKITTTSIVTRTLFLDKKHIALNMFGDENTYKVIPDIGDKVKPNGLLFAVRKRNDWFSLVDFNNERLSTLDPVFDIANYVDTDATVIDVKVIKNWHTKLDFNPEMYSQLDFYAECLLDYYQNLINAYENVMRDKARMVRNVEDIVTSPRLTNALIEAKMILESKKFSKIKLNHKNTDIDLYKVDITVMAEHEPRPGYKIVDMHAAKGVVVKILPDDQMPVDENGVRADIISDATSTVSRMNLGRVYEGYLGAYARDNRTRLINKVEGMIGKKLDKATIQNLPEDVVEEIRNDLYNIYKLVYEPMADWLMDLNDTELSEHLCEVFLENLYLYYPPENPKDIIDVIKDIEKSPYKPHFGPVTYVDDTGKVVTTKNNIRMNNLYYMALDKIAYSFNSAASAKVNNFGFPIKGSNYEKHKNQCPLSPTKTLSETEVRILASFLGEEALAEIMDANLNPVTHQLVVKNILTKDKPSEPTEHINRRLFPYGQNKALGLMSHVFNAAGMRLVYVEEEE